MSRPLTGARLTVRRGTSVADIRAGLAVLADAEVLVGFPEGTAGDGRDPKEPTNPQLAYIHDNGAPEANIPARAFMVPAIEGVKDKAEAKLAETMRAVVLKGGGAEAADAGLAQTGILAAVAIQMQIATGPPPPLSKRTLEARAKGGRKDGGGARKGAIQELANRAAGMPASTELAKPLNDTGALRAAATYAVRSRRNRKK